MATRGLDDGMARAIAIVERMVSIAREYQGRSRPGSVTESVWSEHAFYYQAVVDALKRESGVVCQRQDGSASSRGSRQ